MLTDFLKLFKADPSEGNKTFNITTMLNENWDKIESFTKGINGKMISKDLITDVNDFIVGTGSGTIEIKTLAETKEILGINSIGDATETVKGIVEIATKEEVEIGMDNQKVVTPAGLKATRELIGMSTIPITGWTTTTGDYKQKLDLAIIGVTTADWVDVTVDKEYMDTASNAKITAVEEYNGGISLYAQAVPTVAIPIKFKVTKG